LAAHALRSPQLVSEKLPPRSGIDQSRASFCSSV
jgi:hypothetical protein